MLNSSDVVCLDEKKFTEAMDNFFSVNDLLAVAESELLEVLDILVNKLSVNVSGDDLLQSIKNIQDKNVNIVNNINYGLNSYREIDDESLLEMEMFDNDL